jgi:succinate dehydrogenase / fumarate reductase flavoprotein subunit
MTEIADKSQVFNTARIEALELDNLIEVARSTLISAEARKESRGAHDRADFHDTPEHPNGRNDDEWLKHTLWFKDGDRLDYKPVILTPISTESIPAKVRTY